MKNRRLVTVFAGICLLSILVAVPLLAACAAPAPAPSPAPAPAPEAELPEIEVKLQAWHGAEPVGSPFYWEWPARLIEEATNGRAEVTIYWSLALAGPKDLYRAIQEGIVDVSWVWAPVLPGVFSLSEIVQLPGLFPNQATGNIVMNELLRQYPQFEEQFSPKVKYLSTQVHMRADLHSDVPIRTLDDIKGKVIACDSASVAEALGALGASASVMPVPDMYLAMQRGVIDGTVQAWGSFYTYHMEEVTQYHTLISISPGVSLWFWNMDNWNKFTPEEQQKLELLAPRLQETVVVGNVVSSMEVRMEKVTPEHGHELIEWSKEDMDRMRELFRPMWNEWAEEMEELGYPGQDILRDAERLIAGYVYG